MYACTPRCVLLRRSPGPYRLITEFIEEDSPVCLTRAITRTMIGPCYTPLSLAPRDGQT